MIDTAKSLHGIFFMTPEFFETHEWAETTVRICITIVIALLIILATKRLVQRNPKNKSSLIRRYITNMVEVMVIFVAVILCIDQVPRLSRLVSTVLGASGLVALALSLSAQESLSNLISGLFIALFHPFEVGDRIVLIESRITGTVEDISLRHTILKTYNNTRIVIPNSTMNKEKLENFNIIDDKASSFVDVTIAYESDIDLAMELMADIIANHPLFLDTRSEADKATTPKVRVFARSFADSGINLRANMWTHTVNENFIACSDARVQIKKAFDEHGIEIPYTKYTILHQADKEEPADQDSKEK